MPLGPLDAPFTMEELESALRLLKNGKASGADGVKNEVLKNGRPELRTHMLALFNWLNDEETTPNDWGCSLVAFIQER